MTARVGHGPQGQGRHSGLARAHVSQKQSAHGLWTCHIEENLIDSHLLVGSEGKRQSGAQGTLVGAVHHMLDRLDPHNAHVAAGTQRHLEKSRLVKGEPATGGLGVVPITGVVHRTQRA